MTCIFCQSKAASLRPQYAALNCANLESTPIALHKELCQHIAEHNCCSKLGEARIHSQDFLLLLDEDATQEELQPALKKIVSALE